MTAKDEEKRQDGAAEAPEVKESVSFGLSPKKSFPRSSSFPLPDRALDPTALC